MVKEVFLVTNNKMKILVANDAINDERILVKQLAKDTPEIQSMDVEEIAKCSAKWAANQYQKPVLKMDNSLWIEAYKGFPGPFVAYVDKALGKEGIMKLMEGVANRNAKYIMAVAYCEPGKEPIVESDILNGRISKTLQGEYGWFSDHFFIAEKYDKPMGCYPDEERKKMWPQDFWKRITQRILMD